MNIALFFILLVLVFGSVAMIICGIFGFMTKKRLDERGERDHEKYVKLKEVFDKHEKKKETVREVLDDNDVSFAYQYPLVIGAGMAYSYGSDYSSYDGGGSDYSSYDGGGGDYGGGGGAD